MDIGVTFLTSRKQYNENKFEDVQVTRKGLFVMSKVNSVNNVILFICWYLSQIVFSWITMQMAINRNMSEDDGTRTRRQKGTKSNK